MATSATDVLYDAVISNLKADWRIKFPQLRTDCLVGRVMVVDVQKPCRFAKLKVINDSYNGGTRLSDGTVTLRDATGAVVVSASVSPGQWPFPIIEAPLCLSDLTAEWQFYVDDALITPAPRIVSGTAQFGALACDADIHIVPENLLHYLVRFTNVDTKINGFTDVAVTINNGQWLVSAGPVPVGSTIWIDLGLCTAVANLDFIFQYIDPIDNVTPRTATPDPPPHAANKGCLDQFAVNLGGQIYGP